MMTRVIGLTRVTEMIEYHKRKPIVIELFILRKIKLNHLLPTLKLKIDSIINDLIEECNDKYKMYYKVYHRQRGI